MIDAVAGTMVWHKKFAEKGGHPTLGVSADGQVAVLYYEGQRVRLSALTRDGVGPASVLAKVSDARDQQRPWLSAGRNKGEWLIAWQDIEAGHTEPLAARLACR
jgi:hypothetical protein